MGTVMGRFKDLEPDYERSLGFGTPYVRHSNTSKAAAVSMASVAGGYEAMVLKHIRIKGWRGATSDEVCAALNLTHQNGSARVSTLAKKGLIVRSDRKRKTRSGRAAYVYIVGENQ
jgi:hypothetical protein